MDTPGIAVLHPQLDVMAFRDISRVSHLVLALEMGEISSHVHVGQRQRRRGFAAAKVFRPE